MLEVKAAWRDTSRATPDVEARNERVMENQGLVHQVARGFRSRGVELEDLVQFGNVGLIRAAEKFEPERGLKFSTYATYWIRQAIFKGIANTSKPVRVPLHARKEARAVHATVAAVEAETGVRPWLSEAMAMMEARGDHHPDRSERLLRAAEADLARFGGKPLEEIGDEALEVDSPLSLVIDDEHREQMDRAMALLPEGWRELLAWRYGLDGSTPLSPSAVAALFGIGWRTAMLVERAAILELRRLVGRG